VLDAMQRAALEAWGNPASVHAAGRRARAVVEGAREAVASLCGVEPRDVLFCSSGTEANNLALRDAAALVTSRIEHPSVVRVAEALAAAGRPVVWLPVARSGRIEPAAVVEALSRLPRGTVVALMTANHETGVLQPIAEVAELAHAAGARLHTDAVQALGKIDPSLFRAADSIALAAHKVRGPKGIGALAWRPGSSPKPVLLGGPQERGLRPGTVDAIAAAGFRAAIERVATGPARYAALAPLRDRVEHVLAAYGDVNGAEAPRLPHVSNVSLRGWRGDELVAALDLAGVRVSSGAACSAGTTEPSAVIGAMLGSERGRSALRVSLGEPTTEEEIACAIAVFEDVLAAGCARTSTIA
jgi:cysteine desulfurase